MKALLMAAFGMVAASTLAKDIYINVDFCDEIRRYHALNKGAGYTAEEVTNLVMRCKKAGADGVNWRVASLAVACHPATLWSDIEYVVEKARFQPELVKRLPEKVEKGTSAELFKLQPRFRDAYRATMKSLPDSLETAVGACKKAGLKINFWIDLHDEAFSKFLTEHPECLVHTASGTTLPGIRDYGNAAAVKAKLAEIEELFKYKPDGFYFCTSAHTRHLDYPEADGAFGTLEAATFTDFLRKAKALFRPHGFTLTMGVACGDKLNFSSPYFSGHVKYSIEHDWRTWVDEGIADALVVGDYERLRNFDGVWSSKGVSKAGGRDPAEVFVPSFVEYVKGRVPLYTFSGWINNKIIDSVLKQGTDDVIAFGLDGMFVHEAMLLEAIENGFSRVTKMRKRFDAVSVRTTESILQAAYPVFGEPILGTREVVRYGGLQVIHADGTLTLRMTEKSRSTLPEKGGKHEVLTYCDEAYPLTLTRHIVTHDDCAVAETWVEIRHTEEGPVKLVKSDSFAATLPGAVEDVRVTTLTGRAQQEAKVVESKLAAGQMLVTSSREGIHDAWESNPVMMVSFGETTEISGEVLGCALAWSGTSVKCVRRDDEGRTSLYLGVDHQGGPYTLDPGVTFTTPRAMVVLSHAGKGGVSRAFHAWAHRHWLPHGDDLHPVLLNSWEGSYFSFTEKTLTDMMDGVKEMGGEMFVLDDGWFGRGEFARDNKHKDTVGLGDWVVNAEKLPHGLNWLSQEAAARGLKFGLWVEPEMVNTKSALYTAHPDWMLQEPKRRTLLGRGKTQNVLDLCNPAVRDCIFGQLDDVYSAIPLLAYVKWDANAPISNLGAPSLKRDRQANLWFDYTMGLYDLLARFQVKYPHIMVQACASGGGRMDYGFLRYADEFWGSDRTDPCNRIFIQWGESQFYPASAMACHVTASPNHQTRRETPLSYRFDVAMMGRFGFELHPKNMSAEELTYAKSRVAQYKRIRPLVQQGDLYRLISPYEKPYAALMYVAADKKRAVLFVLGLEQENDITAKVRLDGIEPAAMYCVGGETRLGAEWISAGIDVPLKGKYASAVIEINAK